MQLNTEDFHSGSQCKEAVLYSIFRIRLPGVSVPSRLRISERLRRSFTTRTRTRGKLYDVRKCQAVQLAVPLGSGFS